MVWQTLKNYFRGSVICVVLATRRIGIAYRTNLLKSWNGCVYVAHVCIFLQSLFSLLFKTNMRYKSDNLYGWNVEKYKVRLSGIRYQQGTINWGCWAFAHGRNVQTLPFVERRQILSSVIISNNRIRISDFIEEKV